MPILRFLSLHAPPVAYRRSRAPAPI